MGMATTTSRILGLVRDSLSASLFGAGAVSDAFWVAFRIPNTLRDLLAEGALSSAFIPAFAQARQKGGDEAAWRLTAAMVNALLMVMGAVVLLGMAFSPLLITVLAPGLAAHPGQFALTVKLNRLLFPFIACMAFGALFTGVLNARRHFLVPALAPAITNLGMIAAGIFLCPRLGPMAETQVFGWALGALAGGMLQFTVHVPPVLSAGFKFTWNWPFSNPEVRKVFRTMLPAIFALSITQINLLVNQGLASVLPHGAITYLTYGNRLMQFPLGIFGVAIATAVLPSLSDDVAASRMDDFKRTLTFGMRLTLFITVPAVAGLMVLAEPINQLLFQWGRFTAADAHAVAMTSLCYAAMVVPASLVKLFVPAFYALGESSRPVRIGCWTVALNLAFNLGFMAALPEPQRYLGIAASTTLVSLCYAASLFWALRNRVGRLGAGPVIRDAAKCCLAAAAMAAVVAGGMALWVRSFPGAGTRPALAAQVAVLLAAGVGSYFLFTKWLGLTEWQEWFAARENGPANTRKG